MARLPAAVVLLPVACLLLSVGPVTAGSQATYTNHTVGENDGWVFDAATNKSATNYASWAASQSFFLGDYLIFQTNVNSTVIQTYNKTTYGLCSLDEDYGNLTTQWTPPDGADGGPGNGGADAIAVPLTVEGDNYYFSSADDGIQCQNGMRFHIVVSHGSGLPPDLNQPPPPPPAPAAPSPSVPIEATPSSQSETFYRGDGGGGRRAAGRLALAFSGGFLLLLQLPPLLPSA